MADAKIKIIVNANDAINNLNKLQKEVDFTQKSFSKLANDKGGFGAIQFQQVINQIKKDADIFKVWRPGIDGVKKASDYVSSSTEKLVRNFNLEQDQIEELIGLNNNYARSYNNVAEEQNAFNASLRKTNSGLTAYGKKVVELLKNIMGFQLIIATGRKTLTAITSFFKDSVKAAAQAEQVYNKLTTVFDKFSTTANKSAKQLASTLGVAGSTAAGALSTIGDLLQAQGMGVSQSLETASSWAKQLQDIIAFKDLDMTLEEFAQTFMSGAAGNLRNFRTFGSIVKESAVNAELAKKGYDKLTGSELELAKMTTRAELALKQQANAIGATEREWDTVLSVQRRLDEQQKTLRENFGNYLNTILKPIKSWWTSILEEINKSIKAQKEYMSGAEEISVYDIKKNEKDRQKFFESIAPTIPVLQNAQNQKVGGIGDFFKAIDRAFNGVDETNALDTKRSLDELNKQLIIFGASVDDIIDIFPNALNQESEAYLRGLEEQRKATIENTKALEKRISEAGVIDDSYQSFYERLASITGATGLTRFNFKNSELGTEATAVADQRLRGLNIRQALESITNTPLEKFGDTISTALDEQSEEDLLGLKAEALKSVFTEAWNNAIKNGEDPLANEQVLYAKEQYKATKQQIDILKAQEEAVEDLKKKVEDNNKNIEQSMQALVTKINPFASTFNAYEQGSTAFGTVDEATGEIIGSTLGGILGILADIASQTEAFAAATSFITDYIVPAFNTIFKPLLPMIEFIGKTVQMLVVDILAPLMPIFQIIASVIVMILTPIRIVAAIIKNIFTAVHNIVEFLLHPFTGGNKWEYENLEAIIDETDDYLKKIWECNLEIADNTDPNNSELLKAYDEMFNQKMINASEYQSLLGSIDGLNYDRLQTWDNGTYRNGSGGTTVVYSGGISFTVNGTNLSSEEIFNEFERWLARQQMGGARVYG